MEAISALLYFVDSLILASSIQLIQDHFTGFRMVTIAPVPVQQTRLTNT